MARVIYGAMITELAGSIGGVTFQRNSSGNIIRLKPNMPVNPSPGQALQQQKLSSLQALWPTLNLTEKGSWDTFAGLHVHTNPWGDIKTLSGYQWFLSCNLNLLIAGEPPINTAPYWAVIDPPDQFTLIANGSNLTAHWPSNYSVAPDHIFIYLTTPIRRGSLKLRTTLFLVYVDDVFDDDNYILTSLFETLINDTWAHFYGSASCNLIARLMVVQENSGLASPFTSAIVKVG